jgi:hypothetical protein
LVDVLRAGVVFGVEQQRRWTLYHLDLSLQRHVPGARLIQECAQKFRGLNLLWGLVTRVGFEPARGAGCACVRVGVREDDCDMSAMRTVYNSEKRESREIKLVLTPRRRDGMLEPRDPE